MARATTDSSPDSHGINRYVLNVDEEPVVDGDGFTIVPAADSLWLLSPGRPEPADELAGVGHSFVVVAPGGAGKSTLFNRLRQLETASTAVDLRTTSLESARERISAAVANGHPIYLDAIDEAVVYQPGVLRLLEQELSHPSAIGGRFRLACRPTVWNPQLARTLAEAHIGFRELRLLPLDRDGARAIARSVHVEPDEFLSALQASHLRGLASAPGRLLATALHWRATRTLPDGPVEAIDHEIDLLLQEWDMTRRQPDATLDELGRVARRLGAIASFCGRRRFALVASDDQDVFSINDLPSAPDPDMLGAPVTRSRYETVLGTALFDPAPGATVSFRQHQHAEFLAARYLLDRAIDEQRLLPLLGIQSDLLAPNPLAGILVWLTALDPSLTRRLIEPNALHFVRSGIPMPPTVRAAIVDGVLSMAERGEADPEWAAELHTLQHPALAEQLRSSLKATPRQPDHVWWLAKLASVTGDRSFVDRLVREAFNGRWPEWVRGAAIEAIGALGSPDQIARLRPLLALEPDEDPDDELLAKAIEVLYPAHISTEELLTHLRPRRNDRLVGSYLVLVGELGHRLRGEDLPAFLIWLGDRADDIDDSFGRLPEALIRRAWSAAAAPEVRDALARLLAKIVNSRGRYEIRSLNLPWTFADASVDVRRHLLVSTASTAEPSVSWWDLFELRLVSVDDARWLAQSLPRLPSAAQAALAACLAQLARDPASDVGDAIAAMAPDHPAYEATAHLRAPHFTGREDRILHHEPPDQENRISPDEIRERLRDAIAASATNAEEWWTVVYWLSVEDNGVLGEAMFGHDLTKRPQWSLLEADAQNREVWRLGLSYLRSRELDTAAWQGKRSVNAGVLRDWAGVYLLTTLLLHQPEVLEQIEAEVWAKFAPAIAGAWNYDRDDSAGIRGTLFRQAPEQAKPHLLRAALKELDALEGSDKLLHRHGLYEAVVAAIAQPISQGLISRRFSAYLAVELLDLVAERLPEHAVALCRQLRDQRHPELSGHAARHLARIQPKAALEELVEGATVDQLIEFAPHINIVALDSSSLVRLCDVLLDEFPYESDPPHPRRVFSPDAKFRTREVRGRIIQLLVERGEAQALEEMATRRSNATREILQYNRRLARARALELAWQPLAPDKLLAYLGEADARLIRSDEDLLRVTMERLEAIQRTLQASGAFRDLWNFGPDEDTPKNEDEISDWIQRQLEGRFSSAAVVDREVHVSRPAQGGIGTRVDLAASHTTASLPAAIVRLSIEAKLVNHPALMTALRGQLVDRYLRPDGRRHGIYLVYWVAPSQRPQSLQRRGPQDRIELEAEVERQAQQVFPHFVVRPFVLDISRPQQPASNSDDRAISV